MRDRKISIQTIKAAPRLFRLRGRFPPPRALIADVQALRDFCNSPSEVLGDLPGLPKGPEFEAETRISSKSRYKGGKDALRVPLLGRSAAIGNATMGSRCGLMPLSGRADGPKVVRDQERII